MARFIIVEKKQVERGLERWYVTGFEKQTGEKRPQWDSRHQSALNLRSRRVAEKALTELRESLGEERWFDIEQTF